MNVFIVSFLINGVTVNFYVFFARPAHNPMIEQNTPPKKTPKNKTLNVLSELCAIITENVKNIISLFIPFNG